MGLFQRSAPTPDPSAPAVTRFEGGGPLDGQVVHTHPKDIGMGLVATELSSWAGTYSPSEKAVRLYPPTVPQRTHLYLLFDHSEIEDVHVYTLLYQGVTR
jgi:hypothetical protein